MDTLLFFCFLSVAFTGLTGAVGILPDVPLLAAVGDAAMFTTTLNPSQTQLTNILWRKGSSEIVKYENGVVTPAPGYEGRITLFINSAALELWNVALNDSGAYDVAIVNNGALGTDERRMDVYERVSGVMAVSNATQLLEFNSSVHLTCSASGSALSFLWLNHTSEVTVSDRVQITDEGSTVIITTVTRYDEGPFTCHVSNPVSNGTSSEVKFSISFGPENVNLKVSPSQLYHKKGSDVILSCSADSRPAAQFDWFLNGELLSHSGQELRLNNIQMDQSGNYSCQAFNQRTLRYQTSQPSAIHVLEIISGASIKASENLLLEGKSVNLTCEAAGSIFSRTWLKDGLPLILDENMSLHDEHRVLLFHTLQKTNKGEYSCMLSSPISKDEATYTMIVNYGPENIIIKGPSDVKEMENIALICSADSTPAATYNWTQNGTLILTNSNVFNITKTELDDSGNYTCYARNALTQKTLSALHRLSVTALGEEDQPQSLSPGAIAGITIACLVVAGIIAGVTLYIFKKSSSSKGSTSENTRHGGMDNTAFAEKELNYAEVKFPQKRGGTAVQLELQNNSSDYAQIQVSSAPRTPSSPPTYDDHIQRIKRPAPQSPADVTQLNS